MIAYLKTTFSGLCVTLVACAALADENAALLRMVDNIRAPGSNFAFTLDLSSGDLSATMSVSVKDNTKSLIQYVAPAKLKGRSILFVGRNMWIYVPNTRRPLRISPQQRVLGGVSSADAARVVYSEDYKVVAVTPSEAGDVLQLAPRTKAATYARIDLTIDDRAAPQKAEYFVDGGRKIKTVTFSRYQSVLGEDRPTRLTVVDHINEEETIMDYSDFKITETPEAWYQPGYLSRL